MKANVSGSNDTTPPSLARMQRWVEQGWYVIPLDGKEPLTSRGVHDASRNMKQIRRWARQWPDANVGGACGGKLVIDVDVRSGGQWPDDLPVTRRHLSGRDDGGGHLVFALTEEQNQGLKSGTNLLGPGVDVKTGAGSYVVLPGSIHPDTGKEYTATLDPIVVAPDDLLEQIREARSGSGGGSAAASMLAHLMANPPQRGGRNEWLTKVAGHFAKEWRTYPDKYESGVAMANQSMADPLDEAEVRKITNSIWNTEISGHPDRDLAATIDEDSGWLGAGDFCLMTMGIEGSGPQAVQVPVKFARFDLRLRSILVDPDSHEVVYDLLMLSEKDRSEKSLALTGEDFGDPRALRRKLASVGGMLERTDRLAHQFPDWAGKLHAYIRSQDAPQMEMVPSLGWNAKEGGYLTGQGVIDADGMRDFARAKPSPELIEQDRQHQSYGMADEAATASEILGEALGFHEEDTTALFGSWWAANLVKHAILECTSMFPVMGIEAASGSGKTTGFFSTMIALSGSTDGPGHYTTASLRDTLARNANAITWVDDMDDLSRIHTMIRVLTAGETLTKMAGGNATTQHFRLVGSLVVSGESLSIGAQKALQERMVLLQPGSPTGRRSLKPGREDRPQWEDVVELRRRMQELGGAQQLAGHLLRMVARVEHEVLPLCYRIQQGLDGGRGRDRAVALLVGALVLEYLRDGGSGSLAKREGKEIYARVRAWLQETTEPELQARFEQDPSSVEVDQAMFASDNTLTQRILPEYFTEHSRIDPPLRPDAGFLWYGPDRTGDIEIVVSPRRLALWLEAKRHRPLDPRTESAESLLAQMRQLRAQYPGLVESGYRAKVGAPNSSSIKSFWRIKGYPAKLIFERSLA